MSDNGQNAARAKKGLTKTHIILIVGFVLVIGVIIGAVWYLTRPAPEPEAPTRGNPVVDENNLDTIAGEIDAKMEKSYFETYMNTVWKFPDSKSPSSSAVIGNSAANNYPFYFEVALVDTDEVVYTSSLVPVGMNIKQIILEKALPAGRHTANVRYHLIDEDGEEIESALSFKITLEIGN